jgi:hypothetical protein
MPVFPGLIDVGADAQTPRAGMGVRLRGVTSGKVVLKAPAAVTDYTATWPAALPGAKTTVRIGADGQLLFENEGAGGGGATWESVGGFFSAKTVGGIEAGDAMKLVSRETDGAAQVAHILDTSGAFSTGKLASFRNAGTEKASLSAAGLLSVAGGLSLTGGGIALPSGGYVTGPGNGNAPYLDYPNFPTGVDRQFGLTGNAGATRVLMCYTGSNPGVRVVSHYPIGPTIGVGLALDGSDSVLGDSLLLKSAATGGEMSWTYDGVKSAAWSNKVTTTDGTATTAWSEPLGDTTVHVLEVLVVARRTDAAGLWSGRRRVTVYRSGGGATIQGAVETLGTDVASGITPTVTIDVSGNDVRVRVTGEAAKTIAWRVFVEKVHAY